jgi:DedD protein
MRYTADAAMESQGLRDIDRWKDKIEVRLDNRQVAFLFFGSALVACMLFILGVIVGKRLESRGRAVAPEIEDPLALLDRVATTSRNSAEASAGRSGPAAGQLALAPAEVPARPISVPPPTVPGAPSATRAAAKAKPIALVPAPAHQAVPSAAAAPAGTILPPRETPKAVVEPAREPAPKVGKSRFVLQIGSFLDRSEAEAFAKGFAPEGPNVVVSELPGKGTWYRVRVGEFKAFKDAVDAKTTFERRYNKIALVVGPL